MTQNKRIIVNVLATYGRSLFSLACGLFSGRWVLQSLGEVDLGLFGVVGGLTMFITFLNEVMAAAVGRYYAVAVGATKKAGNERLGLDECRRWFNVAFMVHTILPIVLVSVGYPLGYWVVANYLNIPADRVDDCVMVWRCTCFTCLSAMVSVPFRAMYGAKQEIAELTVYSFAQTICRVTFLYYMVTHPGVWLAPFALGSAVLVVVPQVIIALRALVVYPECKIMPRYFVDWGRLKDLARFAGCQLWGSLSGLATGQGQAIVLNKYFGAAANAANGISYQVTSHICTLAGSLNGAFSPALMNAAGADEWERVKRFMFVVCRVGSILLLIFVIPAALEMDQLLLMWLKTPPAYTCPLCLCALFGAVCEQMTEGYSQAIYAKGKIGNYQFWIGNACFAAFFGAWIMAACGVGVMSIGYAYILLKVQVIVIRLVCGRRVMGYSIGEGLRRIILPIFILMIIVGAFAIVPQLLMQASFGRVCVTTIVAEIVLLPFAWIFLFDKSERDMVHDRFLSKILGRLGWPRRCAAEQEG